MIILIGGINQDLEETFTHSLNMYSKVLSTYFRIDHFSLKTLLVNLLFNQFTPAPGNFFTKTKTVISHLNI